MERGRRVNLRPGTLSALAHALGVSIDYLVDGAASPPILEHRALLYETDEEFLGVAATFLGGAAELAEGAIAVTSPARIEIPARSRIVQGFISGRSTRSQNCRIGLSGPIGQRKQTKNRTSKAAHPSPSRAFSQPGAPFSSFSWTRRSSNRP